MNKLQIEQEIVKIIQTITGIANSNIRISYQTSGMPFIDVNENYCFVSFNYFSSPFTKPIKIDFDASLEKEYYKSLQGIAVNLVLYGSNACDNASKIRVMTKDTYLMKNLRSDGIYLICDTEEPRRVPVMINQQWYDQVYLDLRFYQKIMYNTNRHYINSAEINVISDHKEETITIQEENQ